MNPLAVALAALCLCAATLRTHAQTSINVHLGAAGETIANSLTYASGEVVVTATGWTATLGGANIVQSELVRWSPGIGVKNSHEFIADIPYVPFYVDNLDHYDFVLFQFDMAVTIDRIQLNPSGNYFDTDVSYWMGTLNPSQSLAGQSLSSLSSLGFGSRSDNDTVLSNSGRWITVNGSTPVNTLIVGGRFQGDSTVDRFKIQTLQVTPQPQAQIPEPSALVLLGAALPLCWLRRRRGA